MAKSKIFFILWAISFVAFLFSCSKDSPCGCEDDQGVILEEIADVLPNPFKGFVPWIGTQNPVYETKLQYKTFEWRDVEPQKGAYNWTSFEQGWGNIAATGKRVGFRISACTPGSGNLYDIPDWLVNEGVALRGYSIDGQQGLAPDWDDPKFLQAHQDLINALGSRYDSDPRVAWIDIGSYGFWGEWHVYLNDTLAAAQATKQAILEHYFNAFPTKLKVIAFDDDFATEYVTSLGGGIRNDCLGTQDSNDWYLESLNAIDPTLNSRVWKTAIITGEFCGGSAGATAGTTGRFDLNYDFIKLTHWSFIGPAGGAINPQDETHRQNLDKLHKTLGYRFVLRKVEHEQTVSPGASLSVAITVENKGITPFYLPWPVMGYLVSPDGLVVLEQDLGIDIRAWLPGSHTVSTAIHLPQDFPSGTYDVRLAIPDPDFDLPGILFANKGKDDEGRYLVSRLTIN